MARTMDGADTAAFRAVITTTDEANPDSPYESYRVERSYTLYAGPYRTIGAAKGALTREQGEAAYRNASLADWSQRRTVTGHIERSSTVWERVE